MVNLKKIELEKNNFIKGLSREHFDGILTSKYKKVLFEYFDGDIDDNELVDRVEKNLELIRIYADGKIDPNMYLYSALIDVAVCYYAECIKLRKLIEGGS